MPTRTGLATLVTAAITLIVGRIFGIFELYIVGASMFALVVCALGWVLLNARSLSVQRKVSPQRLHVGATSRVTISLSNERWMPTPVAQITDDVLGVRRADAHVPPLRSRSSTRASYGVPAETRGLIEIGPMHTRITDPFGLASVTRSGAPDTSVLALPRIEPILAPPQPGGDVAMRPDRKPGRIGPSGEEFSALRDYAVGDDLRKVHWASTARRGELMVRTEHIPEYGRSLVVLDNREVVATPEVFERMVSATASILAACRARGDTVRLSTSDGSELVADDSRSFDRILDHLALIAQAAIREPRLVPNRVGARGETAVLVAGMASQSLLAAVDAGSQPGQSTVVVRFEDSGARPINETRGLRSVRMIDVGNDDSFADQWSRKLGTRAGRGR